MLGLGLHFLGVGTNSHYSPGLRPLHGHMGTHTREAWRARGERQGLPECLQQGLRFEEVRRVKAFGEPSVEGFRERFV